VCIARKTSRPPAWRVRVHDAIIGFDDAIQGSLVQDLRREVGDFVVWRAENGCAYQLAVVVDDAEQRINAIVRGTDLLDSTPRQILLQRLLGFSRPGYAHLPLATGVNGCKLSKHEAALPVDAADPLPALRAALGFLGQAAPSAGTPATLLACAVREFDAHRIPCASNLRLPIAAVREETS
jgi:glutamyl-Q tRNA(Asp) synthetase